MLECQDIGRRRCSSPKGWKVCKMMFICLVLHGWCSGFTITSNSGLKLNWLSKQIKLYSKNTVDLCKQRVAVWCFYQCLVTYCQNIGCMHQGLLHDIQFNPPNPFKWIHAITSNNIFSYLVQSSLKKTIRTYFNPSFAHMKSLSSYSWFQVTHLLSPTSRAPKEHHWFQNGSPAQSRSARAWRLVTLMKQLPNVFSLCVYFIFV